MSAQAEKVVYDPEWFVYRIKKPDGVIAGTEYDGYPLGWDTEAQAEEKVEERAELAEYRRWLRESRGRSA